ncbi:uncharacterized protein LOC120076261 [Benincasa hispida]|uniref:uncharacterized protein LOC120076261 n=1 Tax=Benincasa hispida TaxID=102211 RepID=UPI0019028D2D|nr:uncharacterized protein LOC120076261 [Benincasa hispida]
MEVKLEKMQFLGIFGILQEAYKIIYTWRKIFSQITLFLIFPLSLFFLAYIHISNHMAQKILFQITQTKSQKGPPRFVNLSDLVMSYELAYFSLFIIVYSIFLTIISIPSTSVVTHVVACIYTDDNEKVSFTRSLKVVTKVWKRVMITSFYSLGFSFTYDSVAACVLLLIFRVIIFRYRFYWHIKASILIVFMVMYMVGSLYLSTIWMLSKIVSVLEESYGFKALMKSQRLFRGKMVAATILIFFQVVVCGALLGMISKSVLGIFCLVLFIHFLLYKVVVLTILYFVCKLYHREDIDMSDFSSLVEIYVSLKANDVQVETESLLV